MQTLGKLLGCLKKLTVSAIEREASIVNIDQTPCTYGWCPGQGPDGKGLTGINPVYGSCMTFWSFYSLELAVPQKITRVQITPRLGMPERARNIRINIGPSKSYDPYEPFCLPEISQLVMEEGLTDYLCIPPLHEGKFVKIFRNRDILNLCEVKIFTLTDDTTTTKFEL